MFETYANLILQGVLIGGLYALFAIGLSLSLGVMRFVNIAHGDFIVFGSFAILLLTQTFGISPFIAAVIYAPIAFGLGWAAQRFLLQRIVGKGVLPVVLVTFGLSIIAQNGLLEIFGPDTRKLSGGALEIASAPLGPGLDVGLYPLAVFAVAVATIAALDALLYRSSLGARIRAVADDPSAADLIGLSSAKIYAVAMGIVGVTVAIAACAMAIWTNFDPTIGPSRLLAGFEAVVLGGLGSLWGTLAGGVILGLAQNIGGQFDASWQSLAQHLVFLVMLIARPQGLFVRS